MHTRRANLTRALAQQLIGRRIGVYSTWTPGYSLVHEAQGPRSRALESHFLVQEAVVTVGLAPASNPEEIELPEDQPESTGSGVAAALYAQHPMYQALLGEGLPPGLASLDAVGPSLTFLGTGSAEPSKYRASSALLLRVHRSCCVLLDCGEGTWGQMVRCLGLAGAKQALQDLRLVRICSRCHRRRAECLTCRTGASWRGCARSGSHTSMPTTWPACWACSTRGRACSTSTEQPGGRMLTCPLTWWSLGLQSAASGCRPCLEPWTSAGARIGSVDRLRGRGPCGRL